MEIPVTEAYIIDAARTPVGRKKGSLSHAHPADLGAHVLKAVVERNDIAPLDVEDVIFGCVDTRPATSRAPAGSRRGYQTRSRGRPSTGSAAPPSRRSISPPRP